MNLEEQLWSAFQSKFAKLLNRLPGKERKQYYQIFGLKKEIMESFDFDNINSILIKCVQDKRRGRKRTRFLRKLLGLLEEGRQKDFLIQFAQAFAKGIFENKSLVINKNKDVFVRIKVGLENVSKVCRIYPCPVKKVVS